MMRKIVLFIILLFVVCVFILCFVFHMYSNENISAQIVTISKIMLQSVISGLVTFLGLFITISFNEYQIKQKELIKIRPVLYFEPIEMASALIKKKTIIKSDGFNCSNSKKVRKLTCTLCNSENNSVKNIYLKKLLSINMESNYSDTSNDNNLYCLYLNAENSSILNRFYIQYEDIMGNKYKQTVKYKFDSNKKTYTLKMSIPRRRLL